MSDNNILEKAIAAFNSPEEQGDRVEEYISQLQDLLKQCEKGSREYKIIVWMITQLASYIGERYGAVAATAYTEVRLASKDNELPVIEAFNFEKKAWEKINL